MSIMFCLLPHVCLVPPEGVESPGTRVTDSCEPPGRWQESDSGLLQKQTVFLTAKSSL